MKHLTACLALGLLAACGGPERIVATPKLDAVQRTPSRFASLEVIDVSLPAYAERNEITTTDGETLVVSDTLWADQPSRAMTLALTRHLSEITGARVASEPWPFEDRSEARLEVRVEELIVTGPTLRMTGQYFVADREDRGRDHAHLFALTTPLADDGPATIARARAQITLDLAATIAARGL